MDQNNYSHILIIKVWDNVLESTTNYGNIESKVKERFLEVSNFFKGINLWKKNELSQMDKAFGLSDIVIDSPYQMDELLLQSVTNIISDIEKELHQTKKMHKNNKIIFKIIKPLKLPLAQKGYIITETVDL